MQGGLYRVGKLEGRCFGGEEFWLWFVLVRVCFVSCLPSSSSAATNGDELPVCSPALLSGVLPDEEAGAKRKDDHPRLSCPFLRFLLLFSFFSSPFPAIKVKKKNQGPFPFSLFPFLLSKLGLFRRS